MEILVETYTADEAKVITEASNDGKHVGLSGIFMQAETKNRNGRIYRLNEMINAVNTLNETIKQHGGVIAECDHPHDRLTTELKSAAAIITECRMDGNNAVGKMKILDTPYGNIIKELIRNSINPGVSSRGTGTVGPGGIVEGFTIQTIDIVAQPSCIAARPLAIYESLQDSIHGIRALDLATVVREDKTAQKYFIKEVKKFLDEIKLTK